MTLVGQSGGALKISLLLAMPAAQPLFHRAILQSGTASAGTAVRAQIPAEALAVAACLRAAAGLPASAGPGALAGLALEDFMRAYKSVASLFSHPFRRLLSCDFLSAIGAISHIVGL